MRKTTIALFIFFLGSGFSSIKKTNLYIISQGNINFKSEAPLELIEASSGKLNGILDLSSNDFIFSIQIRTFDGFNSELQREHFNENYMESSKYTNATYKGKILETNLTKEGEYEIATKGKLNIHGVEKERTIKGTILIKNNSMKLNCHFEVPLIDHNIQVPTVVNQKIAQVIKVHVEATFIPKVQE